MTGILHLRVNISSFKLFRGVLRAHFPCAATVKVEALRLMPSMHTMTPAARSTKRTPMYAFALLLASAALLAPAPAAADQDGACARVDDSLIEDLADANPETWSSAGCGEPGAEEFEVCEITNTPSLCSAVPACSQATYATQRSVLCTPDTIAQSCCAEMKSKSCPTCEVVTDLCMDLCPRPEDGSDLEPTVSSLSVSTALEESGDTELSDATCARAAELYLDILTQQLLATDPPSCSEAEPDDACDTLGYVGLCSSVPACSGLGTALDVHCTSEDDDSGCCTVLLAKPCPTCDPEPGTCIQSCLEQEARVATTGPTSPTSTTSTASSTSSSSPSSPTSPTSPTSSTTSTSAAVPLMGLRAACAVFVAVSTLLHALL